MGSRASVSFSVASPGPTPLPGPEAPKSTLSFAPPPETPAAPGARRGRPRGNRVAVLGPSDRAPQRRAQPCGERRRLMGHCRRSQQNEDEDPAQGQAEPAPHFFCDHMTTSDQARKTVGIVRVQTRSPPCPENICVFKTGTKDTPLSSFQLCISP